MKIARYARSWKFEFSRQSLNDKKWKLAAECIVLLHMHTIDKLTKQKVVNYNSATSYAQIIFLPSSVYLLPTPWN